MGLHGHNSHPLDCQLRSQIQGQMKSEPPFEGGASDDKEEAMKARERLPNMPSPTTNQIKGEQAPSFIGEMHPSNVWSQSATYLVVFAKLSNMQKTLVSINMPLQLPRCQCCRRQCSVRKAGSPGIQTTELFRTLQDVIVPEGPAVRCSTYQQAL